MGDDTKVCPSLGLKDQEAVPQQEEDRILKHMTKKVPAGETAPGLAPDAKFGFWLEGFPAQAGKPVVVVLEGRQVYHSGNLNGEVKETFKVDLPPITAQSSPEMSVQLKIGLKDFDNTIKVDLKDGRNLKLVFTDKGLQMQQRSVPF